MGSIGGAEILVIALVALIIFGPDKLPMALKNFGKVMGEIKKYQELAKSEIDKAVASANVETEKREIETRPEPDPTDSEENVEDLKEVDSQEVVSPILDEDEDE